MSFPAGGILAVAIAARLGPIENCLDATAHTRRCFRLAVPNRLQHLHNQSGPVTVSADGLYRHATKDRIGVCLQGRLPLRGVLDVFPSRLMRLDVPLGTLAERDVGPRRGVIDGENGSAIVRSVAGQLFDTVEQFGNRALAGIVDWR